MTVTATRSLPTSVPDRTEAGFTLIETMIALVILVIVAAGVLPLGLIASSTSENQGHLMARTSEYAQDKLEQLLALSYGNTTKTQYSGRLAETASRNNEYSIFFPSAEAASRRSNSISSINHVVVAPSAPIKS